MLDLKVKDHDFQPIQNAVTTCRKCGIQVSVAVLMWGGAGLDNCPGTPSINLDFAITDNKCECGATKALGIGPKMAGHSFWCPWSP